MLYKYFIKLSRLNGIFYGKLAPFLIDVSYDVLWL